ncbi:MAG TPA: ATP-binding protein [Acidimicrobiales bacterium]
MSLFPFSAVVGQDDAQLALLLAAVDPGIGGVLLRGDKGSAKSTLARGLAGLLAPGAPFVELPIGATEDRVVGSLDVGAALSGQAVQLRPGLLAGAHNGVLYVDEVNLLPDHLVDVLLDAAASGVHRVERDGVSHTHPARFVLIGSMNPEEGELRPQLLDRFGLAVEIHAPSDPSVRTAIVRARLGFERGEPATGDDRVLAARIATARPAAIPDGVVDFACRLAVGVGAEGLRGDLVLCRAAAALAGWEGRSDATVDDVERVAGFALAHRRHRRPLDPPTFPPDELRQAIDELRQAIDQPTSSSSERIDGRWSDLAGEALDAGPGPLRLPARAAPAAVSGPHVRGPVVGDQPPGPDGPTGVAVAATLRAGLLRRSLEPAAPVVTADDLRQPRRRRAPTRCVVLAVDTSGSMGSQARVQAATGAVLGLLADAYRRRDRVALVAFRGQGAEEVLAPTASVEIARSRLADLPTGGATPLAEGLDAAHATARRAAADGDTPLLVVLTDARATSGPDALDRALAAAGAIATAGIETVVLDAEDGTARLSLAARIADALGAICVPLAGLSAAAVETAIRSALEA